MESDEGSVRFGFIPKRLAIVGRPDADFFPLNVLFARWGEVLGQRISGAALYEPDAASLKCLEGIWSMKYENVRGGDFWLLIQYAADKKCWTGKKFRKEKEVGTQSGSEWNRFFGTFTCLGVANGEMCEIQVEPLEDGEEPSFRQHHRMPPDKTGK